MVSLISSMLDISIHILVYFGIFWYIIYKESQPITTPPVKSNKGLNMKERNANMVKAINLRIYSYST